LAARNDADTVFGKAHGAMQGPGNIFRHTRERCSVSNSPAVRRRSAPGCAAPCVPRG